MEELIISPYILALLFFLVALIYSSVGLGGGSSYTALLTIFNVHYLAIPTITLTLNLFVTTTGAYNFIRQKHARLNLILPFFISSIPMSYVGGSLNVPKEIFYWVLLVSLFIVALRIYFWKNTKVSLNLGNTQKIIFSLSIGGLLGLISGIAGIGGGIYLIPIIIIFGLGTEKEAAACGSLFIWFNSLAGLAARLQHNPVNLFGFVPVIIAVIIGGSIGSYLGSAKFSPKTMEKILGMIIVVAIFFLVRKVV